MVFLSALFVLSSITSLSLGANSLLSNPKDRLNKIFFVLTLDISAWAFTYSLMNISQDVAVATAFHRVGTIFYSLMYAILLHFILVLVKKDKYLRNMLQLFLFYIPAFISIYLYFFYKPVTVADHVKTSLGYVYIYPKYNNLILDYFFHIYYISYTATGLYMLVKWSKDSKYLKEKKQAKILIETILAPFAIGSVSDIVIPMMQKIALPPISVILFNIPIIGIWYSMKKYKLMNLKVEELITEVLEMMKEGMIILDPYLRIRDVNKGMLELTGYEKDEICTLTLDSIFDTEIDLSCRESSEMNIITKTGRRVPILLNVEETKDKFGDSYGYLLLLREISQLKELQSAIIRYNKELEKKVEERTDELKREKINEQKQREKYQTLFDNSQDAIVEFDLEGNIVNINKKFEELFGYTKMNVKNKPLDEVVFEKDRYDFAKEIGETLMGVVINKESIRHTKDGNPISVIVKSTPIYIGGTIIGGFIICTDITENKQYEQKLSEIAIKDSLTGFYNLNYFVDYTSKNIDNKMLPMAMLIFDINGLKLVNDSLGRDGGDRLLKTFAEILKTSVGKENLLFRIGGDEFLILLKNADKPTVENVIRNIQSAFEVYNESLKDEDKILTLSVSYGYSLLETENDDYRLKLKEADDMMNRNKLLEEMSNKNQVINILMSALSERDYVTSGHTERVMSMCKMIAAKMNLSEDEREKLILLAQVHDIGKIGIPDDILNKKGKLTKEEWEIMKSHSEKGYKIAINSPELSKIADLILHHHERWDGNGYPMGLKGTEIPIECRILAIVDAYDAMTSQRPYNTPKTHEEAIEELKRNAGTQFDPTIVEVFIECMNKSKKH
ncbi:PAS domain S-box-containing protein/diguanylate cyclase (GGDEF) domain-containing protein [Fervidobacterium changbaicum]|uniref:HD domain-containing phosphohydrolase n=1 Tax=Fervidobacterium TaxID=2422 RepID=UPI0008921658|nr:HD domain-containing phosphohydrolase [Fervidobacterium changbaicum]SDH38173.1 PAS domain S-box-containing protein/diguanylate cyclase (GGDEF) domain-containing protein [Fervidobacterium changbaicum]